MDTVKSFKVYGKVDELETQSFQRKTRKRIIVIIISISLVLLMLLIIGVVVGTLVNKSNSNNNVASTPSVAIKSICSVTQYPDSSATSLHSANSSDPENIFQFSLQMAMDSLQKFSTLMNQFINDTNNPHLKFSMDVCTTVLNDAIESLNDTISAMNVGEGEKLLSASRINDTDQEKCFNALDFRE